MLRTDLKYKDKQKNVSYLHVEANSRLASLKSWIEMRISHYKKVTDSFGNLADF